MIALITKEDLQQAIAECQGERNPTANTCIKLAAYYTILDNMEPDVRGYSRDPAPVDVSERFIEYQSGTEFSKLIHGKDAVKVWAVMDELMDALRLVLPKMYSGTVQKIRNKA